MTPRAYPAHLHTDGSLRIPVLRPRRPLQRRRRRGHRLRRRLPLPLSVPRVILVSPVVPRPAAAAVGGEGSTACGRCWQRCEGHFEASLHQVMATQGEVSERGGSGDYCQRERCDEEAGRQAGANSLGAWPRPRPRRQTAPCCSPCRCPSCVRAASTADTGCGCVRCCGCARPYGYGTGRLAGEAAAGPWPAARRASPRLFPGPFRTRLGRERGGGDTMVWCARVGTLELLLCGKRGWGMMKGCGPVSSDIWRSSLDPPPRPPDAPAPPAAPSVSDACVGAPPDSCSCSACCCCLGDCDSCRGLRPRLPVDGNRGGDI